MKELLQKAIKSRKFMLVIAGIIGVILTTVFEIKVDQSVIDNLVSLIGLYIIGESGVDALGALGGVINKLFGKDDVAKSA